LASLLGYIWWNQGEDPEDILMENDGKRAFKLAYAARHMAQGSADCPFVKNKKK
jgi:hypothetical protein